ncbi:hypothetical protein DCS_00691 [Drechmeria coniospora]|uniref:Uncharacterized protein n=1 Tax=Drechmeria coniospora TaxID=98403 RepID=A0A151GR26_DRECN|nr:hypothetical protein DCS_00691 [Drechmeria coniospora]KYK59559.1 hypothetical protein DCS_00691 [Drechmeria coniospora]
MGRKPNPIILEYFERGPKLNDNSNRYPHTCKQCGENFPKGRVDGLMAHITKKCPAITDSERMRACLEMHGIAHARTAAERQQQARARESVRPTSLPQGWSALETLAEASRQVDLNENSRQKKGQLAAMAANNERFQLHEQYTLDNPPVSYDNRVQVNARKDGNISPTDRSPGSVKNTLPGTELSPEERLQALLPVSQSSPDPSNISVAVAATARLNPSFLDPQLANHDSPAAGSAASASVPAPAPTASPAAPPPASAETQALATTAEDLSTLPHVSHSDATLSPPWGEMTYLAAAAPPPIIFDHPPTTVPPPLNRGGVRMDTSGPNLNGRSRHFRSKFTPTRREEVKEVRKLGACIRCRILRKLCSKGTPCETCEKVLTPRVWMAGCVRTRLHEQLDLYSAGVQVVLSQNRINLLKDQLQLTDVGSTVEVSHFPDTGYHISLATLAVLLEPAGDGDAATQPRDHQVIMINQDREDVPNKVETYMRDVLRLFVEREPSRFMRITLETALQLASDMDDNLLGKALELWGLVECIDRERQWTIVERLAGEDGRSRPVKEAQVENNVDIYSMICMQLNAAAERKANSTSRGLLNLLDRLLVDSKTKAGFHTYLTAMIFLNCVEKSTWAFKAWEQDHLRPGWPLERDPGAFTDQGGIIAGLLKMLLGIRKALPPTVRAMDGKLSTTETDVIISTYFRNLDLEYDAVEARQRGSQFSPADSRSLELMFCSHLLLPTPTR